MRILIVDDEAPARERLRNLVQDLGGPFQAIGEATNGLEALQCMDQEPVDLVLMDIRMPVMDGLEAARHMMRREVAPALIFVTAYEQHALQAFEHHALDYLLKPVRRTRLEQALTRARRLTRHPAVALAGLKEAGHTRRSHLCARYRGSLTLVPVADVLYFRADRKYVCVRYVGGELLLEESLKALEDEFRPQFLRIHRSILVARDRLVALEQRPGGTVLAQIEGAEEGLQVSRRNLPEVRRFLKHRGA